MCTLKYHFFFHSFCRYLSAPRTDQSTTIRNKTAVVSNFMGLILYWARQAINRDLSLNTGWWTSCVNRANVFTFWCHHFVICTRGILMAPTSEPWYGGGWKWRAVCSKLRGRLAQGQPWLAGCQCPQGMQAQNAGAFCPFVHCHISST